MELEWGYFRKLYEDLHLRDGVAEHRRYLRGQAQAAGEHLAGLASLRKRGPAGDAMETMKLYALSRVGDYLIELSCPEGEPPAGFGVTGGRAVAEGSVTHRLEAAGNWINAIPGWLGPRRLEDGGLALHTDFLSDIGLTPFEHGEAFSPFHHEIFAVVQDPSATRVTVEDVLWPGFWFGDLLFSRAGVRVRAPRHLIDAEVATTSTLYFAARRDPRRTSDLSDGWGSNSQWRTRFHRFYSDEDGLHLNWDGEVDISEEPPAHPDGLDDEPPLDERQELLLHRCFVRSDPPADEDDRFPHDDRLTLTSAEWPLRPESIVTTPRPH